MDLIDLYLVAYTFYLFLYHLILSQFLQEDHLIQLYLDEGMDEGFVLVIFVELELLGLV